MKKTQKIVKNGQKILVIKNSGCARVGDLAITSGYDGMKKMYQFHSTYCQPSYKRDHDDGGSYWVEFLPRDCFIFLNKGE